VSVSGPNRALQPPSGARAQVADGAVSWRRSRLSAGAVRLSRCDLVRDTDHASCAEPNVLLGSNT